jgi:signal transduction histidine kinase
MTAAIPFAGLAPDSRTKRGSGELARFDLAAALDLGQTLRKASSGDVSSSQVVATLLDAINAFEHDGRPACVLIRTFVTRRLGELAPELQSLVRAASPSLAPGADPLCLRLVATRGIEPAWNDVTRSVAHRALLLENNPAPMVSELARQLRVGDPTAPAVSSFYVPEAADNRAISAKSFVSAYGVRSVFGFGATAWPGELVVVLGFSRSLLERSTARAFETVALYTKAAWLNTLEARAALAASRSYDERRADVLEELVTAHEAHLHVALADFTARLEATRDEATRSAEAGAQKTESHNAQLRRTQRAMLNVIEDLREARGALETQVASRTRELAVANQQLEARNRELEEFVYIASHDLQEPLRTVGGYLQMIQRRYGSKLGIEADEFIGFAIQGSQRMQLLLEGLLLYSRVATADTEFELVPLAEPLAVALQNLALRVEETHAVIESGPLPRLRANRIQMVQLFQNLLSNAIKFAGENPPRVSVTSRTEGDSHIISVRDEGIGFNPKFAVRIFKVFRRLRRDTPGTGIGLAVCKKIAERHGGHIEAEASPGAGATFRIYFPTEALAGIKP